MTQPDLAALKREASVKALDFIRPGMKLGLGTGSTAEAFLEVLAPRVKGGLNIIGVPTSVRTAERCRSLGIPLGTLEQLAPLDIDIDGADESDSALNLIKGGGGALLREKIVAASSKRMIVIADETKLVDPLGRFPLPVEIIEYGASTTERRLSETLAELGYRDPAITLRQRDGAVFKTDSGNLIYDCALKAIHDAAKLSAAIHLVTGVVDHGLFIGLADTLIIAGTSGVRTIEKKK